MRTQLTRVLDQVRKELREGREEFAAAHREGGTQREAEPRLSQWNAWAESL